MGTQVLEPLSEADFRELIDEVGGRILAAEELTRPWPVKDVIHPGLTVMTGQPEVGKTTVLLSLLDAMLRGHGDWLGHHVSFPKNKRVLMLAENPNGVRRAQAMGGKHEEGRLLVAQTSHLNHSSAASSLAKRQVGLVAIDSVWMAVGSPNDPDLAAAFLNEVRAWGVPVVMIQHSSREGGPRPAGSQAWAAAYEHTVHVSRSRVGSTVLRLSGNNLPETRSVKVVVDYDTLAASSAGSAEIGASPKSPKLTDEGQQKRVRELARRYGVSDDLGHNQWAAALLLGGRDKEDAARLQEVREATGRPKIRHRGLADLMKQPNGA